MRSYRFIIADVFTEKRFGGNQLAVLTDAKGLDAAAMQEITREMNYAETTFLLGPEAGGDFRLRIFTPAHELPFAGHPIVGSSYVVVSEELKRASNAVTTVTLETGVGLIRTEVRAKEPLRGHATMTQPLPVVKDLLEDQREIAAALSIAPESIGETGLPIEAIDNGITVIIVPVPSLREIQQINVDTGALERITRRLGAETVLAFTRETVHANSNAHCRVFAPGAGVIEDAATGSANGPLGYYLVRHGLVEAGGSPRPIRIISEQGYEMKRPSSLEIEVDLDPQTREVAGVRVGGGVVISGRGEIFV